MTSSRCLKEVILTRVPYIRRAKAIDALERHSAAGGEGWETAAVISCQITKHRK